jgi:hypothetical protein
MTFYDLVVISYRDLSEDNHHEDLLVEKKVVRNQKGHLSQEVALDRMVSLNPMLAVVSLLLVEEGEE